MALTRLRQTFNPAVGLLIVAMVGAADMARADSSPTIPLADQSLSLSAKLAPPPPHLPLGTVDDHLPQPARPQVSHLVLKLSERTLYLYNHRQELRRFPVAVGRSGWETPTGRFAVMTMVENPAWEHPLTGDIVPPGGDNPLGQRWIGFWTDGVNSIGFHGTPQEDLIGQAVSHGCVRLRNADVVALYDLVEVGVAVHVVP
jgi:L,D-transpeptidase ErfK/SrfK